MMEYTEELTIVIFILSSFSHKAIRFKTNAMWRNDNNGINNYAVSLSLSLSLRQLCQMEVDLQ